MQIVRLLPDGSAEAVITLTGVGGSEITGAAFNRAVRRDQRVTVGANATLDVGDSHDTEVAKDRTVAPHVGGSEQFRKFIQHELIPEIERRYRCSSARAIVGESLAGLFVVETMLLEPTMFDRYIAISPSLWWNDHRLVRSAQELVANSIGHPMQLFLSHGNETDIAPHAAELARVLGEFAPSTLRVVYEPHPEEQHHTIFRAVKKAAFLTVLRH